MDDKIRTILDQMPEKNRSKLERHADVIRELRRKGRTYEEIANFLSEHFDLKVAPSTIHAFVRVRARRHQRLRIELRLQMFWGPFRRTPTAQPPKTVSAGLKGSHLRRFEGSRSGAG